VNDATEITEIDAPPRAYFDIPTGDGFDAPPIRLVFRTLCLISNDRAKLEQQAEMELNVVRSELQGRGGGIIWWRSRPSLERDGKRKRFTWRCRLETSPQLPEWFWKPIEKSEGVKPVMI
jgi:hypothetical protein